MREYVQNVISFYLDGFREMTTGRLLWKIVLLKLVVLFLVLKLFFFPNYLQTNFASNAARADHVLAHLTGGDKIQAQTAWPSASGTERPRSGDWRQPAGHLSERTRR